MKTCWRVAAVLLAVCGPARAAEQGVSGSWRIVSRPGGVNTCEGKAEESAYQWIVTESRGEVSVVVQGETAYPGLRGRLQGGRLQLEGEGRDRLYATARPNSVFVLDVKPRSLRGTRYLMHFKPGRQGGVTTCLVTYDIRGEMR